MIEAGAYGERMAGYLHLTGVPIHAALGSGRSELAVTRLQAPMGFTDPTSPIPLEKAFSIHLHLRANQGGRLWLSGKLVPTGKRPSGGVTILDLEEDPIAFFPNPIDVVQFYIPRMALEEFAYENRIAMVNTLSWPHCETDATLKHLGMAVLSAIQRNEPTPKIFLDYIGQTILAHATSIYGATPAAPGPIRGQLVPWQSRRAMEFLDANLYGDVSLASVAAECNLSVSHFAHAFRRTFGRPPHRWLMERRIDAVKNLLLTSRLTLAEVASKCGFADQSALNRSFKRVLGESPGEWRRSRKGHH
ncbi:AraC family transcriptional regulator [Acidobacterium sp. S8]|uniref:helix-turn-helix transcriptional regulator n=1 Tax=Acidobacterium sp. S8 TaxID=1641854 RepID=UPI00131DA9A1|nr:AraC family transcriptional regulator [Acidobacterium sp. S8]